MIGVACGSSGSDDADESPESTVSSTAPSETSAAGTAPTARTAPTEAPPPTTDREGRLCDGGAFPRDEEFRFLVCDVQYLQLDVIAAGHEADPEWVSRASRAILTYDVDREASVAALQELKDELSALLAG